MTQFSCIYVALGGDKLIRIFYLALIRKSNSQNIEIPAHIENRTLIYISVQNMLPLASSDLSRAPYINTIFKYIKSRNDIRYQTICGRRNPVNGI